MNEYLVKVKVLRDSLGNLLFIPDKKTAVMQANSSEEIYKEMSKYDSWKGPSFEILDIKQI